MISEISVVLRRLVALLTATAGIAQGTALYEETHGPAQFPQYAALTAVDSSFRDSAYLGDNAVVLVESHGDPGDALSCSYTLADIYVPDVHAIKTYYMDSPEDGLGGLAQISDMSSHVQAAFSVNGDFYGAYSGKTLVRNGVRLASFVNTYDLCVLYEDGSMRAIPHQELSDQHKLDAALENAWQVWSFGPVLLREDGSRIDDFSALVPDFIRQPHPRTCIGYYSPGHYCILTVAGYQENMPGVTLEELSRFFSELGCVQAYNLDGGSSTHVWFHGKEIGWPSKAEYLSDLIYIEDTSREAEK